MRRLGFPILLASLGLLAPALLYLVAMCAIRLARSLGPAETIYVAAFVTIGIMVS